MLLLQSPNDVAAFFSEVSRSVPVFVEVVTNGHHPGDPKPMMLRGIAVCLGDRQTTAFAPLVDTNAMRVLVRELMARTLSVCDVYEEALAWAWLFHLLLPVRADLVLARHMLRPRLPHLPHWPSSQKREYPALADTDLALLLADTLPAQHSQVEQDYESILSYHLRVPYEIELHATSVLAQASAFGYRVGVWDVAYPNDRVHPTWHTTHASGSTNITAAGPPLTSLPLAGRREYCADAGYRWAQIEWPDAEVAVLAGRSGSPWLAAAYRSGVPYEKLAEIWNVSEDAARDTFRVLLASGPDETLAQQKISNGADCVRRLAVVAPEWVEWGARLTLAAAQDYGCIPSLLGRTIKVDEPRKACALDVQAAEAMLLKMLLARLHVESEVNRQVWAGYRTPIPVFTKVAYQIDMHVPLDMHVPAALHVGALLATPELPLRVVISMGPTWGHLTRVTVSKESQAEQELLSPASYAIQCPVCRLIAPDETTLREHLVDAHCVGNVDALLVQARELRE